MSVTYKAKIERLKFERDGFVIFSVSVQDSKEITSAKGSILGDPKNLVGESVNFTGTIESSTFGECIAFQHYSVIEDEDYFWQKVSKIKKKQVKQLIASKGKNPNWLSEDGAVNKLRFFAGLSEKDANIVIERWDSFKSIRDLINAVSAYNIPQYIVSAIHNHYGSESLSIITETPYKLTNVNGVGFKRADEIARKIGVPEDSNERLISAVNYVLSEIANEGSTVCDESHLFQQVNEFVDMKSGRPALESVDQLKDLIDQFGQSINNPVLYLDDRNICLRSHYAMDSFILNKIKNESTSRLTLTVDQANSLTKTSQMCQQLGEEQLQAVINTLTSNSVAIISGYAGTGKTTTSKVLLNLFVDHFKLQKSDIVACALSGVASNRIKTQSGFDAYTIHSLLSYTNGGWLYNETNPLPQKIVVLDEAGMTDTYLFFSLLKAINFSTTKLILLGDPAQIQPVGAGQPFLDLINLGIVKHSNLTKIYRQSDDKAIALVASQIRIGKRPAIEKNYSDVFSYKAPDDGKISDTNSYIENTIIELANKHKAIAPPDVLSKQCVLDYLYSFQVITPRKSGALGTETLNKRLRATLLPMLNADTACKDVMPISVFEKVIHLKNANMQTTDDRVVRVFNGMIGMVVSADNVANEFIVYYPLEGYRILYNASHVKNGTIGYAWSLTVHKTQGSEFGNIAIPFTTSHWIMLNTKLTYTAVTRAKNSCHLVGSLRAFHQACTNIDSTMRNTVMQLINQ